jgi:hypothetical protein
MEQSEHYWEKKLLVEQAIKGEGDKAVVTEGMRSMMAVV